MIQANENEQLIYELNGKKYLLVEVPIISGAKERVNDAIKKHGGIYQGVKKIHQSFWSASYVITKFLIPEENVIAFSNEGV